MFTAKIEKFQLRGNNSVCVGAFQLLGSRAPAQRRGNIAARCDNSKYNNTNPLGCDSY
jgi:hypothetical protein